jgi:hypothetical protein
MYAVGHFALGYLTGKLTAKSLNVNLNLPLLFLASVFPDIDIIIPGLIHRGPLHSAILFCILFIPVFAIFRKSAAPYFIAVIQHIVIGDYFIGGQLQLLWPLMPDNYGYYICMTSLTNVFLEWGFFIIAMAFMIKTKDILLLFTPNPSNTILSIPVLTVLLPTTISFPIEVPPALIIPHLAFLILFTIPIIIDLKAILTKNKTTYHSLKIES